ncbi:mitochondrial ribonuclease P catalytic subunit isoform X2 [Odontomachus brunneus]|uniref:mitochondrial ribonuclease P catalytic subunit isoform X2 n=1 Tax=Odontomachus brunneus TaxID=486640 RepID=UPI0013F2203E|nr:mitochondrial ribonuclease P catalytic subunit isoform X2 [Odontomachus brunneus]XP_032679950.1 mitochondrial ribonuclease P catalytic subunit isoform X2 [Odontomachus brunneus]XP_032679952.1 mitochondrial ribonuclease P catalytic subunit isoform X2 [Odontomachus brunneus]XP_032679953.1 mitochondrial ribonuclease P catalytic subunit isoform X2 [Odontomachus brunneus]XP_032679954.1 mitochondrial ribonuclease P catalytic subunit isoform X2 [Odontomachus brunneus]
MAMCRRLCQPLWSWSYKYQKRTFCVKLNNEILESNTEEAQLKSSFRKYKTVSVKYISQKCSDLYDKIMKEDLSSKDWQDIREGILQNPPVTATTIDSVIMDLCLLESRIDKAIQYFQFLKEHDYPLNVAIIGKYLQLFVLKRDQLTDAEKREIVAICDGLMEKYPCLDATTAERCIYSLCLTDQWEKSYKLIDMIKLTTTLKEYVYSTLAAAAFEHNKPNIGWDAMQKISIRDWAAQNTHMYTSYLQYCERGGSKLFDSRLEKMFTFWADTGLQPRSKILNTYAKVAGEHGWSALPTDITKSGQCKTCSHQLTDVSFSRETFQKLANTFMERVIVGSDIYHKSHPQELRKFTKFVAKTKPYDVVIDGLNITYAISKDVPKSKMLIKVVEYFVKRKKKVLVLTRKHQKKLPALKYIQQNAFVFCTDNLSNDDPYLLYATLASGEKAMFISSDLMRQHKHLLDDKHLQQVFKKWQCSHQCFVKMSGMKFRVVPPFNFIPHAQKNSNFWHISCINDNLADVYEFPDKWYCFHKNKSKN